MPRRNRLQFPGAIYHVTVRGNGKQNIFLDNADRKRFCQNIEESRQTDGVRIYLFCLMNNHFHLLIETPRANLSSFMRRLLTKYTVYFNHRHERSGHLTQGRYFSRLVSGDEYLLALSRYIHLNPIRIPSMQKKSLSVRRSTLQAYRWSSFRGYAGLEKPLDFMDCAPLWKLAAPFGRGNEIAGYLKFVIHGLKSSDTPPGETEPYSSIALGNAHFVEDILKRMQAAPDPTKRQENIRLRQAKKVSKTSEVMARLSQASGEPLEAFRQRRRNSSLRAVATWALQTFAGLNHEQTATLLGMGTASAVSYQLRRWSTLPPAERQRWTQALQSLQAMPHPSN